MTLRTLAAALAAGGLAAAAHAQPPAVPAAPAAPATPQVIRYPGGVVVLNGKETIVRQAGTPGRSTNLVTGSGNGFGNAIVVDGGGGGLTVVSGSRNGVGNRLLVDPTDLLLDLDVPGLVLPREQCKAPAAQPLPPAVTPLPVAPPPVEVQPQPAGPAPAAADPPVVRGRNTAFWTARSFSDAHDCNLYWHPGARTWYRYHPDDDTYRPVANAPAPPAAP